mmetsp:Transcript_51933/g.84233  ORF Transcript_51933/g.84233 Transcript_51933/m.84233 type:complete len:380 (-) Transcript_51933:121-1260(-)
MAPAPQLRYPCSFEAAADYHLNDLDTLDPSSWRKVKTLGEAIFGKVYLAQATPELQKKYPGLPEVFALKQMSREAVSAGRPGLESARNELCAGRRLQKLGLPCLAPIYFVAQGLGKGKGSDSGEPSFFLATEYCELGELFAHLQRLGSIQCQQAMPEAMWQLLTGVTALHEAGIAHRDISLENLLVNGQGNIRLIDFGQALSVRAPGAGDAREARVPQTLLGLPGKEHYRAPEVYKASSYLSTKLDVFACGVLLYTLAVGMYPPRDKLFPPEDVQADRCRALSSYLRSSKLQDRIGPAMLDLLEQMMAPNPQKRMTAVEALEHPWMKGTVDNYMELLDDEMEMENQDFGETSSSLRAVEDFTTCGAHGYVGGSLDGMIA